MPTTRRDDPAELLRLALDAFDAQIAELQATRAQLAALIDQRSASQDLEAATPQKRREISDEARAKISAAAKARWARERKAKVQMSKPATKKAQSKAEPAKTRPATAKAKKATAKKSKSKPPAPAA